MPWIYGELKAAQLERLASDPTPASTGRMYYNTTLNRPKFYNSVRWMIFGPTLVTGSIASPTAIVAASGITPGNYHDETIFLVGSGGAPAVVSANPQIAAGTYVGQRLRLVGTSDANYVELADGTGLSLNGVIQLTNRQVLNLFWDGSSTWMEESRS